jgi:hypothetical protein
MTLKLLQLTLAGLLIWLLVRLYMFAAIASDAFERLHSATF